MTNDNLPVSGTPEKPVKKPKKSHSKMISNIIFLIAMTILMLTLFLSLGELEQIGETIKEIGQNNNYVWLIVALLLAVVYFILWPISLALFAKASKCESTFGDSFLIGSIEHFYNGITPFSVGGQPFQIYNYTKRGVSSDKATGVILANFVTFMLATNTIAFISLFFWDDFTGRLANIGGQDLSWFKGIAIAGFVINFLVLLFMIALGTSKTVRKIIYWLFDLVCRPKWLGKHLRKFQPALESYVHNAQVSFKQIMIHKGTFVLAFIVRFVTMCVFYTIPFFIMKAVGIQVGWEELHLILFGTAFAITSVVFVPTPGGTGGIEYAFAIVIAAIGATAFGKTQAVALMWRLITYYFLMIVSFIFSAILEGKISFRLKKIDDKKNQEALEVEAASEVLSNEEPLETTTTNNEEIAKDDTNNE